MRSVADACGCSRAWLYMLMSGNFGEVPEETMEAIAEGLDVSVRRVRRALQTSQEEAYA
jgi:transcriptional regulator with XRE-family HTH domain